MKRFLINLIKEALKQIELNVDIKEWNTCGHRGLSGKIEFKEIEQV